MSKDVTVVVGLGEVGHPLREILHQTYDCVGVDIEPVRVTQPCSFLHICIPYQIADFVGTASTYIARYKPLFTVIHSTVAPGTTRAVAASSRSQVVYSPVRGKHVRMLEELRKYTKFVGAMDPASGKRAAKHFESAGLKTKVLSAPEATELAKLTETTYFGVLIAWAQEIERYCDQTGQAYDEVVSFYEEISFFPATKYFPGVIGGHCVMPNIEILRKFDDSSLLRAIETSNRAKIKRESQQELGDQSVEVTRSRG